MSQGPWVAACEVVAVPASRPAASAAVVPAARSARLTLRIQGRCLITKNSCTGWVRAGARGSGAASAVPAHRTRGVSGQLQGEAASQLVSWAHRLVVSQALLPPSLAM